MAEKDRTITWLHLSDLHFCESRTGWHARHVLETLVKDLRHMESRHGLVPDLLFFTGDMAFGSIGGDALEHQYAGVAGFLENVRTAFSTPIPKQRVFIVPGNHDVDRDQVIDFMTAQLDRLEDEKIITETIQKKSANWLACMQRLTAYGEFLRAHGYARLRQDPDRLSYNIIEELNGMSVGITGFNTVWSCGRPSPEERGRLWLGGEWQVTTAQTALEDADVKIGLAHHPGGWFKEAEKKHFRAIREIFHFFLHGHEHGEWITLMDGFHTEVSAGACYQRSGRDGYNMAKLDFGTGNIDVWLRMYAADGAGGWIPRIMPNGKTDNDGRWHAGPVQWMTSRPVEKPKPNPPARPTHRELERHTRRYLEYLADRHKYLDFRGMGVSEKAPLRIALADMYVPLEARREMPEGDAWERELKVAGFPADRDEPGKHGLRLSEPMPVADLMNENDGLVILGDPGAGKTTFIKHMALRCATDATENRIPFLIPLSAYANALAEKDISLNAFVDVWFRDLLGDDLPVREIYENALANGTALILMDGLDEVQIVKHRLDMVRRVEDYFGLHRKKGNRFVITSRIVGYRAVRPQAEGLAECTLADFGDREIEAFVDKWTQAVEKAAIESARMAERDAQREKTELMHAMKTSSGVRRLAANPLLLTILALMKRQGVALPERRVKLYDQYTEVMLRHWNLARGLGRSYTCDLDEVETVNVLAPLALWMHETSPGLGLVDKTAIIEKLTEIQEKRGADDPARAANKFLEDVRAHTALLIERGAGTYGFIHLTFQEYLAAVGLVLQGQIQPDRIVDVISEHVMDDAWEELIRLAVAHIGVNQRQSELAGEVLKRLIKRAPGEPGRAAVLAGKAAKDAWPGGITKDAFDRVLRALTDTVRERIPAKAVMRAAAGVVLAETGDPRPEVMTLDAMTFCLVPGGDFVMSETDDKTAVSDVLQYPYWMGRFPVTNAQYDVFINAGGYANPEFWTEAIRHGRWKDGKVKGWRVGFRDRPESYGMPFELPNHPVVGVTWYEAMAFCRWLSQHWRGMLPQGWEIRLPSEAEWEKAARGGCLIPKQAVFATADRLDASLPEMLPNPYPHRRYPWGNAPNANAANGEKTGIGTTSAAGCFPSGSSPTGCEEMTGNVWEWTRSLDMTYPYRPDDGREDLSRITETSPVLLRGGAFYNDDDVNRGGFRLRHGPFHQDRFNGFRLLLRAPF